MQRNGPESKILCYLATTTHARERSKYWIEKRTGLARQTVYDTMKRMKSTNLVRDRIMGRSRAGRPVRYYYLDDAGWMRLVRAPELSEEIRDKMNEQCRTYFYKILKHVDEEERQRLGKMSELLRAFVELESCEGAPPNCALFLALVVDEKGHVEVGTTGSSPHCFEDIFQWMKTRKDMKRDYETQ